MFRAPRQKLLTFTSGTRFNSRNLHDVADAKQSQLPDLPGAFILIGNPSTDKLQILTTRWILKDRNFGRYSTLYEICRLERSGATRLQRYDNDIGRGYRITSDERPSRTPQKRLAKGTDSNNRDCNQYSRKNEGCGPIRPPRRYSFSH
jgi:hypothetical protein